jgi:hypothetical protein
MHLVVLLQAYATYRFTFDHVYGPDSQQAEVYDHSAKRTVLSALQVMSQDCDGERSIISYVMPYSYPPAPEVTWGGGVCP